LIEIADHDLSSSTASMRPVRPLSTR
jgi:hypothetical protein